MTVQNPPDPIAVITRYLHHDFQDGLAWWEQILRQDEWERLDYLIGAALVNPELCTRLLERDEALLTAFLFSDSIRHLLSEIQASSLSEFAETVLQSRHSSR